MHKSSSSSSSKFLSQEEEAAMAAPMFLTKSSSSSLTHLIPSNRSFFLLLPSILAFMGTIFIFYYTYSTTYLITDQEQYAHFHSQFTKFPPPNTSSSSSPPTILKALTFPTKKISSVLQILDDSPPMNIINITTTKLLDQQSFSTPPVPDIHGAAAGSHVPEEPIINGRRRTGYISKRNDSDNSNSNVTDIYHDRDIFMNNYNEMNKSMKIYIYPHKRSDPFANVLLPEASEPGGNYASEAYFMKALTKSHFVTQDPSKADLFFLPFSITNMRNDKRIGVGGIPNFVRDYIYNVSHKYPYWNRSGGADHFYVACHSIGKIAMDKANEVKINAIQIVCSSNYFVNGYVAHKDVPLPQIWPRQVDPPNIEPSKRKRLAFFAGAANSPVRKQLVSAWKDDLEIFAHAGRLKTSYATEFLKSKYCFHVKGFEVNTARIGDALYYGCVPVILADYYDLPFNDVLNWHGFSVVVATTDIPLLKKILKGIRIEEYEVLQRNVMEVRKHFQWHSMPVEFDAFYITMYELWLRRGSIRVSTL